jgi:hypothetical protein
MKQMILRLRHRINHHHGTGGLWFLLAVVGLVVATFLATRIQHG